MSGYCGTPLAQKLGIRAGGRVYLHAVLLRLLARLRPDLAVWVSWPKKASGMATDITADVIREVALPLTLVDMKVCAVDEVWSGMKLVIRKSARPVAAARAPDRTRRPAGSA